MTRTVPAQLSAGGRHQPGGASLFKILPPTVAVTCLPRKEILLLRVDVVHYRERKWSVQLTAAAVGGEAAERAAAGSTASQRLAPCSLTLCLY